MRRLSVSIAVVVGLALGLCGWSGHMHRNRLGAAGDRLFYGPLTSGFSGGTFIRATPTTCRINGASTYTTLASGEVCQSSTYGLRLNQAATNIVATSKALSAWTIVGATVDANDNTGPSGAVDAERIRFTGANQVVRITQAGFTANSDVSCSLHLRYHAGAAACTVDVGTTTALGGAYYGGLVTLGSTWDRYPVQTIASASGTVVFAISNLATLGHGTPTCTDIDAVDAQCEQLPEGAGQYCDTTAGAPATCNAETITWPHNKKIEAKKGTLSFWFKAGERASWEQSTDKVFLSIPVDGGGTWQIGWNESASKLTFLGGGQAAEVPASWAPETWHLITIAWRSGGTIGVRWDDDYPGWSAGNYTTPTFTAGGVITLGGQVDGFYSQLKIYKSFRLSNPTVTHYATLNDISKYDAPTHSIAPEIGINNYVFTGGAWGCLAGDASGIVATGANVPCLVSDAEDSTGPGGDEIGVRIARATTNRIAGGLEAGGAGVTPTGWLTSGAGAPVTTVDKFEGTYGVNYTSNGASRFIYELDVDTGTNAYSYYSKYTAATIGDLLGITYAGGLIRTMPMLAAARSWHRETHRQVVTLGSSIYLGNAVGFGTQPNGTVYTFDATSYIYDSNFHPPFCPGAPPATCTSEAVYGAELGAVAGMVRLYVTPMWGSNWSGRHFGNDSGIDAQVLWNSANWRVYWDNTLKQWTFVAGGQSVASLPQMFPPFSTHEILITYLDGAPLLIQVNGQDVVSSVGNKAAAALAATTYLGTDSGGGSELAGWVGYVEVR